MPTPHFFSTTPNHASWIRIDYQTLLGNIARHCQNARLLDLSLPFMRRTYKTAEEDLVRSGINGVLCSDPRTLLSVSASMQRILRPGFSQAETGYAREGLLPVLSSFSECLNLSNLAQSLDQRLPFLVRARSRFGEFGSGDWGLDSICEKLPNVPMIDLHGFFLTRPVDESEVSSFKRQLRRLESPASMLLLPLALTENGTSGLNPFIEWESVGLEKSSNGSFPLEIGFWAFPIKTGPDYQIFQADLGSASGLPSGAFPAMIGGHNARMQNMQINCCEFVVERHLPGPFPVAGFLTGGDLHAPVDLRQWQQTDLQSLLAHLNNCPVFLQTGNDIVELPA
ncbi:MAG TPA: hypothetical protein PLM07_09110 [Candidatus Rifleibacterium sp.]|nr:hypothetical protein [Candidatus Rifleibacterium sp.]HPT46045.1 hypothetical protein [Candidatus Rifleibacterium sp.]